MANHIALPQDFAAKLMSGIAESRATTLIGGGKPFLRMLKSGEWVFGGTNEEVQPGSRWAINVMTLAHGWSCWVEGAGSSANSLAGEVMASMTAPKPPRPPDIDGVPYKDQRTMDLKCIDGDDAGTEVIHKITSLGGIKAVDGLLAAIYAQLATSPDYPCPVVTFAKDYYDHKKWGRIYTPIYNVVGWADMNGQLQGDAQPALPLGTPSKPAKTPLRAVETPVGVSEPVSTTQARVGQRRRPVAR